MYEMRDERRVKAEEEEEEEEGVLNIIDVGSECVVKERKEVA